MLDVRQVPAKPRPVPRAELLISGALETVRKSAAGARLTGFPFSQLESPLTFSLVTLCALFLRLTLRTGVCESSPVFSNNLLSPLSGAMFLFTVQIVPLILH